MNWITSDIDPEKVRRLLERRNAPNEPAKKAEKKRRAPSVAFLKDPRWIALSREVRSQQPWCSICGATEQLQADHIKPKSKFPELAFERSNLRTLCWGCNSKKAAKL